VDGCDIPAMDRLLTQIRKKQTKPTLIVVHTIIGRGSPHKAGTHEAHGSPLGDEEVKATKKALGLPEQPFFEDPAVLQFFAQRRPELEAMEAEWKGLYQAWKKANPDKAKELEAMGRHQLPQDLEKQLWDIEIKSPVATRASSNTVIQKLADLLPQLYGGSADLSGSDKTWIKKFGRVERGVFTGRNIKYGVREFAMAAMCAGLCRTGYITPFCGTFLTFSDYMRNAIRLSALMKLRVIYQFTHDSIFLGEDGPTHQPIEHLAALRAMPNLQVIRPCDNNEMKMAWLAALNYEGPTALILSRQSLPTTDATKVPYDQGMGRGAYIIRKETGSRCDYALFSTGSEVALALRVADELAKQGRSVRVVSMPCWELFEAQDEAYKKSVVGGDLGKRVAIEAGCSLGWHKYIGMDGVAICIDTFGASAPEDQLALYFGFTQADVLKRIL
jgi:transketolase